MHLPRPIMAAPLTALSLIFVKVGALSFGGAVPAYLLHQFLRHRLLTEKEYLEALNWCQSLPGPLATNLSAYFGWRFNGAWGAILATITLLLPGALAIMLLSGFMSSAPQQQILSEILSAVAAATVGLILGMTWQLARRLRDLGSLVVVAITFILVGFFRIPVPLAIISIAPLLWWLGKNQGEDNECSS